MEYQELIERLRYERANDPEKMMRTIAANVIEFLLAENERLKHNLATTEQTMREYQELAAKRLEEIAKYRDAPVVAWVEVVDSYEGMMQCTNTENTVSTKRVLDPCCGSRMMWFDRQHPDAVFGDKRTEQHVLCDGRTLRIEPDVTLDFTSLPYPDGTFSLVVFDPPHLHTAGQKSWMAAKYGKLSENWRDDLRKGFEECFRVLASNGTLIFKWNETQVKVREVLALTPVQPLFGHPTGRKGLTHWMVFIKPSMANGA